MNNLQLTDKDWAEIELGPFIYNDDEEYFYECNRCKKTWDYSEDTKCVCLYENDYDELISFKDHKVEIISINLDKNKTDNKIEFKDKHIKIK